MTEQEVPKIAERIKFWEEQDRINKALIPRVLKNHDLIVELSQQTSKITETISVVESRINEKITGSADSLSAEIAELKKQQQDLNTKSEKLKSDYEELTQLIGHIQKPKKTALVLSVTAIIISLISMVLVLLK